MDQCIQVHIKGAFKSVLRKCDISNVRDSQCQETSPLNRFVTVTCKFESEYLSVRYELFSLEMDETKDFHLISDDDKKA